MTNDLRDIFDKGSNNCNVFRDVFAISVLSTAGSDTPNTANVLALVDKFCEIVNGTEKSGNTDIIKQAVTDGKCYIHWDFLKTHCSSLMSHFGKLFNEKAFSFTGYMRERGDLNEKNFVRKTAEFLRGNLNDVKKHMEKIKLYQGTDYHAVFSRDRNHHMVSNYYVALEEYFKKYFFPYGFTFYGEKIYTSPSEQHKSLYDWNAVIEMLRSNDGGLEKLLEILNGKPCPEEKVKEPETPSVTVPEAPKEVVPEKKVPDVPPKEPEVPQADASPDNTVTEVTKPVTSNGDGAQNQDNDAKDEQNDKDAESKGALETQHDDPRISEGTSNSSSSPGIDSSDPTHHEVQRTPDNIGHGSDISPNETSKNHDSGEGESLGGGENGQVDGEAILSVDGETVHDKQGAEVPEVSTEVILEVDGNVVNDFSDLVGIYLDGTIMPEDPDLILQKLNEEANKWYKAHVLSTGFTGDAIPDARGNQEPTDSQLGFATGDVVGESINDKPSQALHQDEIKEPSPT
ncbi:Ribosome-binding protein 1, putative [Babesia ovata]|uniref:Ribosome-binding protein 1, putative n=1 Tax=Babesia ovata TaxID=189622 RepID=A0A2H6K811_9APIC|nr:Ribosome-binding protein 1, putative [Babesia ovata]GBE59124.1 Ribosome-binding protein 1, putative [Babesia ovata]